MVSQFTSHHQSNLLISTLLLVCQGLFLLVFQSSSGCRFYFYFDFVKQLKISSFPTSNPTNVIPSSDSPSNNNSHQRSSESKDNLAVESSDTTLTTESDFDTDLSTPAEATSSSTYDCPPPPYSPPLTHFFKMSLNSSSVITQVGADHNDNVDLLARSLDQSPEGNIRLNLRGTTFDLKRQELLRLPESVLLGISNGLVYDPSNAGQVNLNSASTATVNFSPNCFKYTLDVFDKAAQELPPGSENDIETQNQSEEYMMANIGDVLKRYPAIIVLREDLDFYCLPSKPDATVEEMQELKKKCGDILVKQQGVFSGLRKGEKEDSPEHHLISMLCSSGFSLGDQWGFREREPNKTVITSLALVRLETGKNATSGESSEPSESSTTLDTQKEQDLLTSHKLLLFWRKPARKCWWDSLELDAEGTDGPTRVHIRRVWTLELSVIDGKTVVW